MTSTPRLQRLVWLSFALTVLAATAFWAGRVLTGLSMDDQRNLVPVSTVGGMHACRVAIIAERIAIECWLV